MSNLETKIDILLENQNKMEEKIFDIQKTQVEMLKAQNVILQTQNFGDFAGRILHLMPKSR